jgi:ABC-type glycerol-3-phosphate transport system permease component
MTERLAFPRQGRRLSRLGMLAEHAVLVLVAFVSVLPLYMMLSASLQVRGVFDGTSFAPPTDATLSNYGTVWEELGFGRMFLNSTVLSLASAGMCTLLAAAAAFGFVRFRFYGRGVLLAGVIAVMAIPAVVIIIPVFILFSDLGFINTYHGGILVMTGLLLPFSVFLLYSYLKDLPSELFEAADVDGASKWLQFHSIALPLARPALATCAVIAAIFAWNDLLVPLILWQSDSLRTLMVGLSLIGPSRNGINDLPLLMAGVTVSIAPLIVLFMVGKRAVIRGLTEGSYR